MTHPALHRFVSNQMLFWLNVPPPIPTALNQQVKPIGYLKGRWVLFFYLEKDKEKRKKEQSKMEINKETNKGLVHSSPGRK